MQDEKEQRLELTWTERLRESENVMEYICNHFPAKFFKKLNKEPGTLVEELRF